MKRVACVGEAMIELSLIGENTQVSVAGDSLNTAIYLHRTAPKLRVDYITCLGCDPFSARIFDFISQHGLGTSQIQRISDGSPGLYGITTSSEGERSFTYWRNNSAARQLFLDFDFSVLEKYDVVYLSGISMAILPHAVRLALVEWLNGSAIELIFDSNFRPRLWESRQHSQEIISALWMRADIALPSIDDEMDLFSETADQVSTRFSSSAKAGALKRGEQGPLSLGSEVFHDYYSAPNVVDTTAAGDSFNGGYLGALFSGKTQAEALIVGHNLARAVVQYRGAIIPE